MKKVSVFLLGLLLMGCATEAADVEGPEGEDVASDQSSIVGGVATTGTPAVVAILGRVPGATQGSLCTATVVSPTVLLTAAHCVHPELVGEGAVFAAFTNPDISNPDTRGPGLPVSEVHFNPLWNPDDLQAGHDVAVAVLQDPIGIAPIPVNRQALAQSLVGAPARIIGYGLNNGFNQTGAGVKRQATVPLNGFNAQFVRTGTFFGQTICNGDSGGPILMQINGVETVVGVNSFGLIFCLGEASSTRPDTNLDFLAPFLP